MTFEPRPTRQPGRLIVRIDATRLPVSYVSSLLRVLQAAVREVARSSDGTRQAFDKRPHPVLLLSELTSNGDVTMSLTFADASGGRPLVELSEQAFDMFLDRFGEFVRGLPQPGLWGGAAPRSRGPFDSDVARRMDQVHRELRRSPRVSLTAGGRTILVEGDSMEISQVGL